MPPHRPFRVNMNVELRGTKFYPINMTTHNSIDGCGLMLLTVRPPALSRTLESDVPQLQGKGARIAATFLQRDGFRLGQISLVSFLHFAKAQWHTVLRARGNIVVWCGMTTNLKRFCFRDYPCLCSLIPPPFTLTRVADRAQRGKLCMQIFSLVVRLASCPHH